MEIGERQLAAIELIAIFFGLLAPRNSKVPIFSLEGISIDTFDSLPINLMEILDLITSIIRMPAFSLCKYQVHTAIVP